MPHIPSDVCFIKSQTAGVSNSGIKLISCAETDRVFFSIGGKIIVKGSQIYLVPQRLRSSE